MRTPTLACAALLLGSLVACDSIREMGGLLQDLQTLQTSLIRTFREPNVSVNVNNTHYMTVIFVNSSHADQSGERRAAFARTVAEYVRDHYPRYSELASIAVGFQRQSGVAGFSVSSQEVPYQFTVAELAPISAAADSTSPEAANPLPSD